MAAIEIDNLHKSYDAVEVLRGLTLRVEEGQVYGLIGPNGSGKSTLLHLLLGFLRPDRGRLRVLGSGTPARVLGRIGYLPERLRYHLRYTGREYLGYLGRFSGMGGVELGRRIDDELVTVGLAESADRMLSTYSRGMLQRLGVAQALLHGPALLLLDEPTGGLDPGGQRTIIDLLASLRERRYTALMTTHILGEAEQLCDRIGVLFEGRIAAEAEAADLRAPGRSVQIDVAGITPELAAQLEAIAPAVRCRGPAVLIEPNAPEVQARVVRALLDAGVPIVALAPRTRPLEDLYMCTIRGEAPPPALHAPQPPAAPQPAPTPRTGDTLLRELLRREDREDAQPPEGQ